MSFANAYRGKRVLATGHTGFKGSWLSEWLLSLGAEVTGFALPPPTQPSLFDQLGMRSRLRHVIGDVRDLAAVRKVFEETEPDLITGLSWKFLAMIANRGDLKERRKGQVNANASLARDKVGLSMEDVEEADYGSRY